MYSCTGLVSRVCLAAAFRASHLYMVNLGRLGRLLVRAGVGDSSTRSGCLRLSGRSRVGGRVSKVGSARPSAGAARPAWS